MKLTIKQEKFCHKYIECGNASEAYRHAFSCDKMKSETINRKAIELLNNGKITARVEELKAELAAKSEITKERVLAEYAKIAFCSIADYHKTWIDRKTFEELTSQQKSAIKSIKNRTRKLHGDGGGEVEEVMIELHDKLKALEGINKMLGFDSPTSVSLSIKNPFESVDAEEIIKTLERVK